MKRFVSLALLAVAAGLVLAVGGASVLLLPRRAWVALASRGTAGELTAEEKKINAASLPDVLDDPRIIITKGERRLRLYSGGELARVYKIGLGFAPTGDKQRQGDGRTPEGEFYVCTRNERSRYFRALGLSYPDKRAAERGSRDRLITRAEHDRIVAAIDRRERPPWDTELGGEIMIHGNGANSDWTLGCVALADREMLELFERVPLGAEVRIEP